MDDPLLTWLYYLLAERGLAEDVAATWAALVRGLDRPPRLDKGALFGAPGFEVGVRSDRSEGVQRYCGLVYTREKNPTVLFEGPPQPCEPIALANALEALHHWRIA